MKNTKTVSLFLFSLLFITLSSFQNTYNWQLKKFENGISIYTRTPENSKYKELKAVYQIKSSLSSIIAVLNDFESFPKWVYRCEKSIALKKDSDNHIIRYQTVVAPWPVDNRDMVLEVNSFQDKKTKIVYQKVNSIPDYIPLVKGHVRVREFRALWTLIPLKNGFVEVNYELLVNPGGNIPAWLVNLALVDGPFDTSVKMREMLMNEKYQKTNYSFIANPE
jgi:hypothetical protein